MNTYFLITGPDTQLLEDKLGFEEHSYLCYDIPGAYFIESEWYNDNRS